MWWKNGPHCFLCVNILMITSGTNYSRICCKEKRSWVYRQYTFPIILKDTYRMTGPMTKFRARNTNIKCKHLSNCPALTLWPLCWLFHTLQSKCLFCQLSCAACVSRDTCFHNKTIKMVRFMLYPTHLYVLTCLTGLSYTTSD
jgi:hypothetical protein